MPAHDLVTTRNTARRARTDCAVEALIELRGLDVRQAKVANLEAVVLVQQDVGRLQIAVDDACKHTTPNTSNEKVRPANAQERVIELELHLGGAAS